jgi:hypothetical protein
LSWFSCWFPLRSNKKHTLPAAFSNARYAWVESMEGDINKPGVVPEDRQAISDVEDALRDWNRYALTANRSEADLVFIIRKGRLASGKVGVGLGNPPLAPDPGQRAPNGTGGTGIGGIAGGEVGPPDDLLEVRALNSDGTLGIMLWERSLSDGLDAPQVALVHNSGRQSRRSTRRIRRRSRRNRDQGK